MKKFNSNIILIQLQSSSVCENYQTLFILFDIQTTVMFGFVLLLQSLSKESTEWKPNNRCQCVKFSLFTVLIMHNFTIISTRKITSIHPRNIFKLILLRMGWIKY